MRLRGYIRAFWDTYEFGLSDDHPGGPLTRLEAVRLGLDAAWRYLFREEESDG